MIEKSLVSVIVPIYNAEKYLKRCLDSIINQTYSNLDIILIDDGSTDSSLEICREYVWNDSRIQLYCQENRGPSAARNTGLDHMRGEYIVFVDSDDFISLTFVEVLLKQVQVHHVPLVICDYVISDEAVKPEKTGIFDDTSLIGSRCSLINRKKIYDNMYKIHECIRFCVPWGKLFHKKIFCDLRFAEGKIHEDVFLFHKIYTQIPKVCCIDAVLYCYVRTLNSITRKDGITQIHIDEAEALIKRLEYFCEQEKEKYVRTTAIAIMWIVFFVCEHAGEDAQLVQQHLKRTQKRIFDITGKRYWPLKLRLYMIFPALYHLLRK